MHDTIPERRDADPSASFWRRLLHRWFVEYNPLYLLARRWSSVATSARGLAQGSGPGSEIGVAAIAELYAVALMAALRS